MAVARGQVFLHSERNLFRIGGQTLDPGGDATPPDLTAVRCGARDCPARQAFAFSPCSW